MRNHRRYVMLAPALALVVTFAAPTVEAGGGVGLYLGGGGFGVSVGFGDWGIYTRSWSDPYWSIDYNATLAGYGEWVWVSGLGRVWRPWVATSWRPYTHGRWVSTGCGLTWVAYEPWGYIPHHYGSWAYASFGWVWVPGYSYSCANVVWVGSGGYVGWYARPPWGWSHAQHGFRHGYQHGFRDGYDSGYSDGWRDARYATYVDWRHFDSDNVSRHAVTHRVASQNRIEGRPQAPSRDEIRRRGGVIIPETRLSSRTVTVDGRQVTIARPEGVAPSIERNAADTVSRSLSDEALKQRQPLVRPRTASTTPLASSSRPAGVSRDIRPPEAQQSTREPVSSRTQQSGFSARSSGDRPSTARSVETGINSRSSVSVSDIREERDGLRQMRPRISSQSGATESHLSRHGSTMSDRSRSTGESQRVAPQRQQSTGSQRSPLRIERPSTDRTRTVPARQGVSDSRQSQSRSERSGTSRKNKDSEEKDSKEPSRKR